MVRYDTRYGQYWDPDTERHKPGQTARDVRLAFTPEEGEISVKYHLDGERHVLMVPITSRPTWNEFVAGLPQWDIETEDDDVVQKDREQFVSELHDIKGVSRDDAEAIAKTVERVEFTDE